MSLKTIRRPAAAGQFYPRDPNTLRVLVDGLIDAAGEVASPEGVSAVVSPHAGYKYSGATAGHAYARIRGKQPGRVVLLGCSHRYQFPTASVMTAGLFETPLGFFPVDEPFAVRFASATGAISADPHLGEHSLEVQLPFLARAVGIVPIVPVLFGSAANDWHAATGELLATMLDPSDLVVCSTDLSDYLDESSANRIDRHSIESVLTKDWRSYTEGIRDGSCSMCGAAAVVAAMTCAKARNANEWQLLDYRTSAAASGERDRVVGYAAMSMERAA
ncbi:MAG TPA: AmmeMemoRadiSam system protein B [Candidatus Hydrogenedentes bacterium]|nr:AmmeMemoRadiSam system protein B [Candidatus Hydrogenedentota bacterium]